MQTPSLLPVPPDFLSVSKEQRGPVRHRQLPVFHAPGSLPRTASTQRYPNARTATPAATGPRAARGRSAQPRGACRAVSEQRLQHTCTGHFSK